MEQKVSFHSAGVPLAGVIHIPDEKQSAPRPAIILLHGFGSSKDAGNVTTPARMFVDWGYVVLRFDRRGCGESAASRD